MKNIVVGAVNSTKNLLDVMLELDIEISMVFALDDAVSENVSAYYPLHKYAAEKGIPYKKFKKINDDENINLMQQLEPDYIFAIGFSQLVSKRILDIPKIGVIGCHPADLPQYRGRAVVAWQILNGIKHSKITMFKIDEGADSGDIIDQEPFEIMEDEYVGELLTRIDKLQMKLYKRVLPKLMNNTVEFISQNDEEATYCLRRTPDDGLIDWTKSGQEIYALIRAVSCPYPGAFALYDSQHIIRIWRAYLENNNKYIGVPGQIAEVGNHELKIVIKDGLLVVTEFENEDNVKLFVGHKMR